MADKQIHELTNVARNGLGSTENVAIDNGNATRRYNLSNLVWRAGQSVTLTNGVQAAGAWVSTTTLRFTVPLCRPVAADAVTVSGSIYIRSSAGYSGALTLGASGQTVTADINPGGVVVSVVFSSAPSYSGSNIPAIVGLTVTLAFS